jgi:hypothetical protein
VICSNFKQIAGIFPKTSFTEVVRPFDCIMEETTWMLAETDVFIGEIQSNIRTEIFRKKAKQTL